jgi:uncharacterized protein (TIRG00374 family)
MKVGIVDCGNIFKNRAFKALVSIVLLLLVLSKVDLAAFVKTIIKTNLLIFILSFLMLLAQQCLTAYAWSLALNSQSRKISFMRVIQAHFIGAFGGTFLPSSVGIDVIRAYYLYRNTSNGIEAISSIFLCRVIGLLVFFSQ